MSEAPVAAERPIERDGPEPSACSGAAGCPYEAPFPSPPAPRDHEAAVGACVPSASDEKTLMMTTPASPRATVVMTQAGEKPYTVLAHATTVKGVLSAEETETERPGPRYFFARYSMPNAGAVAWELAEDELLKDLPKTPAALQSALEGQERDKIFRPFCVCIRPEERMTPSP
jgi:hypothetical protein